MKKAILYARIALAQDHPVDRLQKQFDEMSIFCQKQNIDVAGQYPDVGSGATFDRPGFKQMLENLETNKEKVDVILITTWDRFSRNLSGALEMIKTLRSMNIKVRSLQDFGSNDFEIILSHIPTKKK